MRGKLYRLLMADILRAYPICRCSCLCLVYAGVTTSHEGAEARMVERGPLMSPIAICANVGIFGPRDSFWSF